VDRHERPRRLAGNRVSRRREEPLQHDQPTPPIKFHPIDPRQDRQRKVEVTRITTCNAVGNGKTDDKHQRGAQVWIHETSPCVSQPLSPTITITPR